LIESDEIVSNYIRYYHLLRHFKPDFQKTLVVGGAGYSFPKDYLKKYPGKQMEVVEIDPGMTDIARQYFRLPDHENLRIFHEDGRTFLNQTTEKYDVVIIDAFGAMCSVPFQLTTIEAVRRINSALNENGLVIVNMISAMEGERGYFFQAEFKTYQSIFPQVEVFKLFENDDQSGMQNLILVASKSSQFSFESNDQEIAKLLKTRAVFQPDESISILTDDLAPVEYYNSYAQKTMAVGGGRIKNKLDEILKKAGLE
jgi:spermidine synthase